MSLWSSSFAGFFRPSTRRKAYCRSGIGLELLEFRQLLTIAVSSVADISATDGKVNGTVASFTDTDTSATSHDFKATINWGDGSTSKGRVVATAEGGFEVTGRHHYRSTGTSQITVTVNDKAGNSASNGGYEQTNLVSDQAGVATHQDPNLVNPWGLAVSPTGPFWVADNGTGLSTLYDGEGAINPLVVTIPAPPGAAGPSAPTGQVFNATTDFAVTGGPSHFIFSTEDGTIVGWNNGTSGEIKVDNSAAGAIYKGLATGSVGENHFLYATNFHSGKIDVFDANFAAVQPTGSFTVPKLPKGYAPFGIENIDGKLIVTYAKQDANKEDEVDGKGLGLVAEFTTDGQFVKTLTTKGALNAPWDIVAAPSDFGQFSNALLIGNFGDGKINAFDPETGNFLGSLTNAEGQPIAISGLWGLKFGNGVSSDADDLYFTAGTGGEQHGLFGEIGSAGDPTQVNLGS